VLIYGLLCFFLMQRPHTAERKIAATMRPIVSAMAVLKPGSRDWVAAMEDKRKDRRHATVLGDRSSAALMEPGEFQTQSIIALALAEACSIYGLLLFFLGARR
jgi:hypothetical protein